MMKRIIASLVIGVSALSGQAFALVGGPFDGNTHGAALDNNSIYQATLSLTNGSGFCYFSPDAKITPDRVPGGGTNATDFDYIGSTPNRSVIYYKGISYVGSCFGTADTDARFIEAVLNATSELGFSATQTNQNNNNNNNNNTGNQQQTTASVANIIVKNNRSFLVNGAFEAKIYQTAPVLRFKGKGELAFLATTSEDSIAGLAYSAYSGLIDAIITFVANSVVVANANIDLLFTQAQNAVTNALAGLTPYLNQGGIDSTYENATKVKIRVSGTRRYL